MTELASFSIARSKACASGSANFVLFGGRLKNRFEIDRHRMIAGRDHVLLMHVMADETVKEREPRAGAPEEPLAAFLVGASGVIDEFGPTIAVTRDRAYAP